MGAILLILLLAVGSCRKMGSWLKKEDPVAHADAMLILMGSFSDRVLHAADLYQEQVAGKIWIVEEGMTAYRTLEARGVSIVSNTQQARSALIDLGVPADSIVILPGDAGSTRMEAEITRDYLLTLSGIDTLLLVSSAEHTRRASLLLNAAFRSMEDAPVICCSPSRYSTFNAGKWWRDRDDIQDVIMEYLKLVNFYLIEKRDLKRAGR